MISQIEILRHVRGFCWSLHIHSWIHSCRDVPPGSSLLTASLVTGWVWCQDDNWIMTFGVDSILNLDEVIIVKATISGFSWGSCTIHASKLVWILTLTGTSGHIDTTCYTHRAHLCQITSQMDSIFKSPVSMSITAMHCEYFAMQHFLPVPFVSRASF